MNNNIPDFQTIMYPMLQLLQDGQPRSLNEVMDSLTTHFKLTAEDLRIKVSSGQMGLFRNRVGWARSYLKLAGLIFYPSRGMYQITDSGRKTLTENISYINIAYLKKFKPFQEWQQSYSKTDDDNTEVVVSETEEQTPDEALRDIFANLNKKLAFEILELLKGKPFSYFEYFVLQLLSKMGYGGVEEKNFEVVGQSGDNGIDGIIYQDKLGIDRIYVQAKRWKGNKVQSKDIRDFIGALSLKGTTKGIFITTSEFTADAVKTAGINPHNRIILIDGNDLAANAIAYNVGVQIKKTYEIKDLDDNFFEEQ